VYVFMEDELKKKSRKEIGQKGNQEQERISMYSLVSTEV